MKTLFAYFTAKRRGAALFITILIGSLLLLIISAVAVRAVLNTSNIEAWQTQGIKARRLDALARSAANMTAEVINSDGKLDGFGSPENVKAGVSSDPTLIITDPEKTYLTLKLKGVSSCDYTVTSIASSDKDLVVLTLSCVLSGDKRSLTWGKNR